MEHHRSTAILGRAASRQGDQAFGILGPDRLLHLYVIGQTGTGKSTLLRNLAEQDATHGTGFCLIDPHGDLASHLQEHLQKPHLYWNVADETCPLGYNPLTRVSAPLRPLITSGLIETLRKQWSDAWGPRMEHLLRYAILALLDLPRTDSRDIMRLFLDKEFLGVVTARITDPQVRQFWTLEYPAMNYKTAIDGVAPIANKLGAFLAHPVVRTAFCEPKEPIRFRTLMDDGGVLIVNLAKGKLGADLANVVGGLIVSALVNAALSRHDQRHEERRPFMVYIDEFHAFTTSTFAEMLAEVRKYGLGVTLAQQHTAQTDPAIFASIMGNVGNLMVFRVGAQDATILSPQIGGILPADLVALPNYRAFAQIMVNGERTPPFTAMMRP